ncbi:hypothetical protein KFJ24_07955 [Marinobacter sediminum]|uniref:hypothetical protein n=1 Tax=Marinobacter sediminum TaxID=256323 RepID=UPI002030F11D|nr:hypothetical protein [Marinobacter sediminum]MCM0612406.1 hypothetical protein [Marinobacter sediminum]
MNAGAGARQTKKRGNHVRLYLRIKDQLRDSLHGPRGGRDGVGEWKHLNSSLWLGVFSCFIVHYLSIMDDSNYAGGLIFNHFGKLADTAFAVITYGLASTTAVAMLKGVYVQQFFDEKVYFRNFDQIDIYSTLVVCIFLFGYSMYAAITALKNAVILSKSETAIPVNE